MRINEQFTIRLPEAEANRREFCTKNLPVGYNTRENRRIILESSCKGIQKRYEVIAKF